MSFLGIKNPLRNYPFFSRMFSTGCLMACGDFASQYVTHIYTKPDEKFKFDTWRNAKMWMFGCFGASPVLQANYIYLMPRIFTSTSAKSTFVRVLVDQTAFATTFISYLFFSLSLMDG